MSHRFLFSVVYHLAFSYAIKFHTHISSKDLPNAMYDRSAMRKLSINSSHPRHLIAMPHSPPSRSHQSIKQSPRQHKPSKPAQQPTRPQLPRPAEEQGCVEQRLLLLLGGGGDAHDVEEEGSQEGEERVEEEAVVGLEAEDAGCDAEEGGG